ncbi:uncharacterized protein SCHCODRAFT_02080189 [Schizophyllum commune H4-8]|uniref:uncharacterized protein n=1 Tax=Schizophyllum commune (strain H4-8 / FGSC 9210) TaxID=578458 RepID=UPI00215FFAFD|nr:uncharacterized protein SCHCODRAFT_02080189 [Schizophyllum commune H4-8]KAI5888100.1 hypothetical protein SCHCODRAFT_02080189 [Schizophyllum commune H4-8]
MARTSLSSSSPPLPPHRLPQILLLSSPHPPLPSFPHPPSSCLPSRRPARLHFLSPLPLSSLGSLNRTGASPASCNRASEQERMRRGRASAMGEREREQGSHLSARRHPSTGGVAGDLCERGTELASRERPRVLSRRKVR